MPYRSILRRMELKYSFLKVKVHIRIYRKYVLLIPGYSRCAGYWKVPQDGVHFSMLADKSQADTDLSHDFLVWETGKQVRYLEAHNSGTAICSRFPVFPGCVYLEKDRAKDRKQPMKSESTGDGRTGYHGGLEGYSSDRL